MKSILYVGATLMIGASIYGFVDYKKTSHSKAFKEMYEEKKTTEPVVLTSGETPDPVMKKEVVAIEKKEAVKTEVNSGAAGKTVTKAKKIKKRKFDTRLFSRGALDERFLDKPVKPKEPNKEKKIPEIKEQ